jgi:hypothetical protein
MNLVNSVEYETLEKETIILKKQLSDRLFKMSNLLLESITKENVFELLEPYINLRYSDECNVVYDPDEKWLQIHIDSRDFDEQIIINTVGKFYEIEVLDTDQSTCAYIYTYSYN